MLYVKTFGVIAFAFVLLGCSIEADDSGRFSLSFGQGTTEEFCWEGTLAPGPGGQRGQRRGARRGHQRQRGRGRGRQALAP